MKPTCLLEIVNLGAPALVFNAFSVSSTNKEGKFDILPSHANFISLIKDFILVKGPFGKKNIKIEQGVLYCKKDKVKIYLG